MDKTPKRKMSAMPPKALTQEEFIAGAENPEKNLGATTQHTHQPKIKVYPWEEASVRADVKKSILLQVPEALFIKLNYLSEKTNISKQRIIREGLEKHLEKLLKKHQD